MFLRYFSDLIIISSRNKYGEGGYIAPTPGDPDGEYLKALKAVAVH